MKRAAMKRSVAALLVAIAPLGCGDPATPPPSVAPCLQYDSHAHWVGLLPRTPIGVMGDPTIDGHLAYVPNGLFVQVVDVSDPGRPRVVGEIDLDDRAARIAVHAGIAYAISEYVLYCIDVEVPSRPTVLGSEVFVDDPLDLAVRGQHVYVATKTGLHAVDVSNPREPVRAGSLTQTSVRSLALSGSHAYVGISGSGRDVLVVDITHPEDLRVITDLPVPWVRDLVASGDRLVATSGFTDLLVFSLANPGAPREIARGNTGALLGHLELQGDLILASTSGRPYEPPGVDVFRARAGRVTRVAGFPTASQHVAGIAARANHLFLVDSSVGLLVFEAPTAPSLEPLVTENVGDRVRDIAAHGDYLFAGTQEQGLLSIDVSDPGGLRVVGQTYTSPIAGGVTVANDHAYVAAWSLGLFVVDVADPTSPEVVGHVETPGSARNVAVDGTLAYVADYTSGLQIIDVSNPTAPSIIGGLGTSETVLDVAVRDQLAYVAATGAMLVIDVSDPGSPSRVASVASTSGSRITLGATHAFVSDPRFAVIDISVPHAPVEVGELEPPHRFGGVAVVGDFAYVTEFDLGVLVVDASDPRGPTVVGGVGVDGPALHVLHHRDRLFIQVGLDGIAVGKPYCNGL